MKRNNIQAATPIEGWLCTVAKNMTLNRLKKMAVEWKAINHLKAIQSPFDNATQNKLEDADWGNLLGRGIKKFI